MILVNRILFYAVLPAAVAAALFSFPALAQSQDEQSSSVADAARRAREQKKKPDKPARVINDDNLKPASPTSATPASAAPTAAPARSPEELPPASSEMAPRSQAASPEKKESSDNSAEAASMKAQLEELQKELDLLQREVPLARDNFYSKPDYAHDTAGKAKLDALLQHLNDKQQDVEALKARLATLLQQLAKEQPASAEKPTTRPQP
jgi:predicted RNase H-like nuclease (RuvC/YqgF family)